MKQMLEMIMQQRLQQIPQGMMKNLEQQLKRINPQAFKEYQQARESNQDPNEYLNKVVSGFNPQQRQSWDTMMKGVHIK